MFALLKHLFRLSPKAPPLDQAKDAIATLRLPPEVMPAMAARYPHLTGQQWRLVEDCTRDFLRLCATMPGEKLVVPSRLVFDVLEEFAKHKSAWQPFCRRAYGTLRRPLPLQQPGGPPSEFRIWLSWELACKEAGIDPSSRESAPLLFALDEMLRIDHAWRYRPYESRPLLDKRNPQLGWGAF